MDRGRVLSIQSHVAYGYVGQKAAVFPLQCLGFDVDVINSVNFSNHTGYGRFDGTKLQVEELRRILDAMRSNELLNPSQILTGYMHGASALSVVAEIVKELKAANPDRVYLLDPVMGDQGQLYVSEDMVSVYKSMLPLASVITPNWFEVEILTGIQLTDFSSVKRALKTLHTEYRVPHIVISSIPLKSWLLSALPAPLHPTDTGPHLLCLTSSADAGVHARAFLCIPGYFVGTGDLFSALVLAHLHSPTMDLPGAVSVALSKTHAIIQLTRDHAQSLSEEDCPETDDEKDEKEPARRSRRMRGRELRIIQGQDIIRGAVLLDMKELLPWDAFWDS